MRMIVFFRIHMGGIDRLNDSNSTDDLLNWSHIVIIDRLGLVLYFISLVKILKAWHIANNILLIINDRDLSICIHWLIWIVSRRLCVILLI